MFSFVMERKREKLKRGIVVLLFAIAYKKRKQMQGIYVLSLAIC